MKSASSRLVADSQHLLSSIKRLPPPASKPVFIALSGLPGTGKTYFSKRLAERLPLVTLESDALRKILFQRPTYHWRENARLFQACYYLIEILLTGGICVLLDATNLSERYRKRLYNIAERVGVKFIMIKLVAPPEVIKSRLQDRKRDPLNLSDADWDIYQQMKPKEEEIRHPHYVVDTKVDINSVLNRIVKEVRDHISKRSIHGD